MFRRDVVLAAGGYPLRYAVTYDLALWIALAKVGELAMIDQPLSDIRYHASQTTLSPLFGLTRFREALELYRLAGQLPGLSTEARRLGRAKIATLHYVLARELLRARRPLVALVELTRSFQAAPWFCLQRAAVHISRGLRTLRYSLRSAMRRA
jgi:hypothetical protein